MMRGICLILASVLTVSGCVSEKKHESRLSFDAATGVERELTMSQGDVVKYKAYTKLYYVENVEDSTYQYLNVFVPEGATQQTPILLRTYVGGYMASQAGEPQGDDLSGRALKEGYVVVIPGTRGRNSVITTEDGKQVYTGRAPKAILDLKAAIRYLRLVDKEMLGDAEKIITDGTSAGGAMSSLMGATGNNPDYEKYLKAMGAADTRDDVFASICFCPITDLDHADMAYEWLYGQTDSRKSADAAIQQISAELAAQFPAYIDSLKLTLDDGTPLTSDNYLDFIKREIIRSAQIAKNAGADISEDLGFTFSSEASFGAPPINGGMGMPPKPQGNQRPPMMGGKKNGEYITDLDMPTYLNYVVSTQPLKTAPAFDSMISNGSLNQAASGENQEFGDSMGSEVNFTDYVARLNGTTVSDEIKLYVKMLNPMNYIGTAGTDVAQHWYIRHGARDRDTAFPIALNLAYKLKNAGKDVNYLLAWNRPHSGDYALDEVIAWMNAITQR